MQSIEINGLNELINRIDGCIEFGQVNHRALHERIAEQMQEDIDAEIMASGFQNPGLAAGWQGKFIGSGGGYAAVRAVKGEYGKSKKKYPIGYVVNALENGHKVRPPGKTRPRALHLRVEGYHFYDRAKPKLLEIAAAEAEKYLQEIADRLQGK
jgi:hypothetical protein